MNIATCWGRTAAALAVTVALALPGHAQPGLMVATSDFQTGSLASFAPGAAQPRTNLLLIHSDVAVRYHDGLVWVLNRLGQDNVLVVDPAAPEVPVRQFSVGNGSNPQDIAFAGPSKAYVSRLESPRLLVVDPSNGEARGEIDLTPLADADGIPEAADMQIVGSRLYVACQRLDRNGSWGPTTGSVLAVIDTATDALVDMDPAVDGLQGLALTAANPISLTAIGGKLVVGGSAFFGDQSGGVEVLDLTQGTSTGLRVTEAALGGDLTSLVMVSSRRGYAIVSDASYRNSVVPIDLLDGTVGPPLAGHSGGYTPDMAFDGTRLIVADRGTYADPNAAGVLFYDAATGALLAGPVSVGLPPVALAVLTEVQVQTAVREEAAAALPGQAYLGAGYPNPFNGSVVLPFAVNGSGARLLVRNALGQVVRVLADGALAPGVHQLTWDGRDAQGARVGNGTYLVELVVGAERLARKVTVLE